MSGARPASASKLQTLLRFAATVRHLLPRQIATRLRVLALRRWWKLSGATLNVRQGVKLRPDASGCWPSDIRRLIGPYGADDHREALAKRAALEAGQFSFLGRTVCFGDDVDWQATTESQLWRYHLQYFGWVPALIIADTDGSGRGATLFRKHVMSWIAGNRWLRGDGWHPYTLSLRIVNWLKAWAVWQESFTADPAFTDAFSGCLADQVHRLELQLEFDVRGNHLLENARAMYWAGVFFADDQADRWRAGAERIFAAEIPEQVLADGGHFERAPGYHTTMQALLCEVIVLALRNRIVPPKGSVDAVRRMGHFLRAILGPDGRIPLIKDTAYDAAVSPDDVLWVAGVITGDQVLAPRRHPSLEARLLAWGISSPVIQAAVPMTPDPDVSGFFVRSCDGDFLVVDCGQPCPAYLPAHAHADALSYEFHVGGHPLVVDSGVYEYAAGPWREYFRSTTAHNTVEIAQQNSSDVWASFRVGRRARVKFCRTGVWRDGRYLVAEHDGYRRLPQRVLHRRCFIHEPGGLLAVLDLLEGSGSAEIHSLVHLHPGITCVVGESIRLQRGGSTAGFLFPLNAATVAKHHGEEVPRRQGWYSERFGERLPNTVIAIAAASRLPQVFGYVLTRHEPVAATLAHVSNKVILHLRTAGSDTQLAWSLDRDEVS